MDIKNHRTRGKSSNFSKEYSPNNNMMSLDTRRSLTDQDLKRLYLDHAAIIDLCFLQIKDGVPSVVLDKEIVLFSTISYKTPGMTASKISQHDIVFLLGREHKEAIVNHYNNVVFPYYAEQNTGKKKKKIVSIAGFLHGTISQENALMVHVNAFMVKLQEELRNVESEAINRAKTHERYKRSDRTGRCDESLESVLKSIDEVKLSIEIVLTANEKKYFSREYLYIDGIDKCCIKAGYNSPVCAKLLGYAQRRRLQLWLYEEMYNTKLMDSQYWKRLDRRIFNTVDPGAHNPMNMSLQKLMLYYYGPVEWGMEEKELLSIDDMKVNRDTFEKFVSVLKMQCFTTEYHRKKIGFREKKAKSKMKKSKSTPKLKKKSTPKLKTRQKSLSLSALKSTRSPNPSPGKRKVFSFQLEVKEGEEVIVNLNDRLKNAVVRKIDPIKSQVQIEGDENWYSYLCLIKPTAVDQFKKSKKSKLDTKIRRDYDISDCITDEQPKKISNIAKKKEVVGKQSNEERAKNWQQELEQRAEKNPQKGNKTDPINLSDTEDEDEENELIYEGVATELSRSVSATTQEVAATLTGFSEIMKNHKGYRPKFKVGEYVNYVDRNKNKCIVCIRQVIDPSQPFTHCFNPTISQVIPQYYVQDIGSNEGPVTQVGEASLTKSGGVML